MQYGQAAAAPHDGKAVVVGVEDLVEAAAGKMSRYHHWQTAVHPVEEHARVFARLSRDTLAYTHASGSEKKTRLTFFFLTN